MSTHHTWYKAENGNFLDFMDVLSIINNRIGE